jgi:hypothetical protein
MQPLQSWFIRSFDIRLLRALWTVDAIFILGYIALGVLVVMDVIPAIPDILSLGRDWGLPEMFGYLKWVVGIVLLGKTALRDGSRWPMALGVAFLIIVADDALMIHENLGGTVGRMLPDAMNTTAISELVSFGLVGISLLAAIAVAFAAAGQRDRRKILTITGLIAALSFFAVVIDMAHESFTMGLVGYSIWVVVEDGGEMLLASALLAYVYRSIWQDGVRAVSVV